MFVHIIAEDNLWENIFYWFWDLISYSYPFSLKESLSNDLIPNSIFELHKGTNKIQKHPLFNQNYSNEAQSMH